MINNLIVISDLHCGCRLGLCPPEPQQLDLGGVYLPSILQKKVWQWWVEFWGEWVVKVTRGEPFVVVVNGDTINGNPASVKCNISENLVDQARIAKRILEPIKRLCAIDKDSNPYFYIIRGTEAHVGKSSEEEERLAEELGAMPDKDGNFARYELWLRLGGKNGCLTHIMHHIGTTGSMAYETTAVMKEYAESCAESARWGLPNPDIIIRSHRHRHSEIKVPTDRGDGICTITPGWQLKTPFAQRILGGRNTLPQFGGILVRQGDEEHYTRHKIWSIQRTPEVIL